MNGHVSKWLGAYLDGELSNNRLRRVQAHLDACEVCREELEGLRRLSQTLQSAHAPEFPLVDQFATHVTLQLSHAEIKQEKRVALLWWLIPAVLLAAWFFLQVVLTLSGFVSLLDSANLLGGLGQYISGGSQQTLWFVAITNLFGESLGEAQQVTLSIANQLSIFISESIGRFFWQGVISLLYLGWLAVWWLRRGQTRLKVGGDQI